MNSFGQKLLYGHNHEISFGYGKMIASNTTLFAGKTNLFDIMS